MNSLSMQPELVLNSWSPYLHLNEKLNTRHFLQLVVLKPEWVCLTGYRLTLSFCVRSFQLGMCVCLCQNTEEHRYSLKFCPGERAFGRITVLWHSAWLVSFYWKVRSAVIWRQCVVALAMMQISTKRNLSLSKESEESLSW